MPDIFISYAREDAARIQPLVHALETRGWSVFWDRRIPAGQTWRSYIGKALSGARCVLVAWSRHSVESGWVSEEADEGKERGILIPILLDPVSLPMGFRSIQTADLTDWHAESASPRFEQLLRDIETTLGATPKPLSREQPAEPQPRSPALQAGTGSESGAFSRRRIHVLAAGLVALLAAGGGLWIYRGYVARSPSTYRVYRNHRFRYSIEYPADLLTPQGEAADGSGQRFVSRDGRVLLVTTGAAGDGTRNLGELYESRSRGATVDNPTKVITYKVKRDNWFVVSGYDRDRVWYEKAVESGGIFASFRLEYHESQKQLLDPVVEKVAKSFAVLPEAP